MRFSATSAFVSLVLATVASTVSAVPLPKRAVDPSLVVDLGWEKGINPTGTGDCDGAIPGGPKIPCQCPPDRPALLQALSTNIDAGFAVNNTVVKVEFPTDSSIPSQLTRIHAIVVTLQNLEGPGKGCPLVSTTLGAQAQALEDQQKSGGNAAPAVSSAASAPVTSAVEASSTSSNAASEPTSTALDEDTIARLAPEIGFEAGQNPTGTGDCSGVTPGSLIPCSCPPSNDIYIQSLTANVLAGHAVNNTVVQVPFPTDDSFDSQLTRINAAIITFQNLRGPGVGCPAVASTFIQQRDAINAQKAAESTPSSAASAPSSTSSSAAAVATSQASTTPSTSKIAELAPDLGGVAGQEPTGTGDCKGPNPGGPFIPCSCPPPRDEFISQLEANVNAGFAINNPSVKVSYPLDDSVNSQKARIIASLITLQNLKGPGVGCPAASTTLNSQLAALG